MVACSRDDCHSAGIARRRAGVDGAVGDGWIGNDIATSYRNEVSSAASGELGVVEQAGEVNVAGSRNLHAARSGPQSSAAYTEIAGAIVEGRPAGRRNRSVVVD